jgi:flagellar biosynthesis protein FlhF
MDGSGSSLKGLEGGLAEIKELLLDLTHRTSLSQRLRDRPEMVRLYRDLVNAELDPSLARALVERVAAEPNGRSDPYRILESSLARLIRVGSPLAPRSEDLLTGPRFVAVVGPSGVGKTTTTAKLAAHWASGLGRRVGLISLDTFRLGASEQIRAYARIMGLPCRVAQDREQLTGALELFETMDLVLIDTSGRASARPEDARELEDLLGAIPDLSVLLVLSATTKDRDLSQVIRRHESYSFLSLVISKIDETLAYGNVMNNLIKFKKPVSFLTNGQKVPDDLVPATAGRLAELVVASIRSADKA